MTASRTTLFLTLALFISCGTQKSDSSENDSTAVAHKEAVTGEPQAESDAPASEVDASLNASDTLYNVLARAGALQGEFIALSVVTENFLDANSLDKSRNLLAVIVWTGAGEYQGARDGFDYETEFATLAVFEETENGYKIIDHAAVGESYNHGLVGGTTEAESLQLSEEQFAVITHAQSSEEGAGDYGFRKDEASIYVLLNNKISSVFEFTPDDYVFSSNEMGSSADRTITSELSVLEEMTKGLFDIQLNTTQTENISEEPSEEEDTESPEESEEPAEESEEQEDAAESEETESGEEENPITVYKWNGTKYEAVESD